jgi:hypothetical protein
MKIIIRWYLFPLFLKIGCFEHVGATLWDPLELIEANGGTPPLTYAHFCHVTLGVGPPARPCPDVDLASVEFASLPEELQADMRFFTAVPTPEMLGFVRTIENKIYRVSTVPQSIMCLQGELNARVKAYLEILQVLTFKLRPYRRGKIKKGLGRGGSQSGKDKRKRLKVGMLFIGKLFRKVSDEYDFRK